MDKQIADALYSAAGSTTDPDQYLYGRSTPSHLVVATLRNKIVRFLENVPNDMTALEIYEELTSIVEEDL